MNAHSDRLLDRLQSPTDTIEYLRTRYGIQISLASFYSMISRKDGPKVTYFRNRPKFIAADIDEWVRSNLSNNRKWWGDSLMAENNKDKLPHLAWEIKSGLDLAEKGKQDRIKGLVDAAVALQEAPRVATSVSSLWSSFSWLRMYARIAPNRVHEKSASPKVLPNENALALPINPGHVDCALTLDEANNLWHRVFR
jgi:predicted DNA-binding transcriptional regulator AlpA